VHPNNGGDDTRGMLGVLLDADDGGHRLLACSVFAHDPEPQRVYVHSKITIVDDRWLTIGSANLNEHSLFNDTEMNLVSDDPTLALETRLRLWSEHLELPIEELRRDPIEVIDELWHPLGKDQLARRRAGHPLTHRLVRLPHLSNRSGRALGALMGLFVDG
jgi:phosphatidylserine/phosphatidylglycerophosphate/cardiolipin synthase-like enzyme